MMARASTRPASRLTRETRGTRAKQARAPAAAPHAGTHRPHDRQGELRRVRQGLHAGRDLHWRLPRPSGQTEAEGPASISNGSRTRAVRQGSRDPGRAWRPRQCPAGEEVRARSASTRTPTRRIARPRRSRAVGGAVRAAPARPLGHLVCAWPAPTPGPMRSTVATAAMPPERCGVGATCDCGAGATACGTSVDTEPTSRIVDLRHGLPGRRRCSRGLSVSGDHRSSAWGIAATPAMYWTQSGGIYKVPCRRGGRPHRRLLGPVTGRRSTHLWANSSTGTLFATARGSPLAFSAEPANRPAVDGRTLLTNNPLSTTERAQHPFDGGRSYARVGAAATRGPTIGATAAYWVEHDQSPRPGARSVDGRRGP